VTFFDLFRSPRALRNKGALPPAPPAPGMLPPERQMTEGVLPPDPAKTAAADAARAGDWSRAADLFAAIGEDWERRASLVYALGRVAAEDDGWLRQWQQARPDDPGAALVEADGLIRLAWKLRGGQSAAGTTPEQFGGFRRVLPQAEAACRRAAELAAPNDPTPYAVELPAAYGLGYSHERMRALFTEVVIRDPHHQSAHDSALQYWCGKWRGSKELADSFARQAAAYAPAGAGLSRLPLSSWFEHRPFLKASPDDRSPELTALIDAGLADAAAATHETVGVRMLRHLLAYYLYRQQRYAEAVEQFRHVDGWIGATPWRYAARTGAYYCLLRDNAFRSA